MGMQRTYLQLNHEEVFALVNVIKNEGNMGLCGVCHLLSVTCDQCTEKNRPVVHVLIENYIPLVLSSARKFSTFKSRDDLVGVGLLAVVEAVSRIPKLKDLTKFDAYVHSCIVFKMKEFVLTDGTIRLKVNRVKGNLHLRHTSPITDYARREHTSTLELREILAKVIKTDVEQVIIDCLMQGGFSNNDIAEMCDKSAGRISQIKNDLMARLAGVFDE